MQPRERNCFCPVAGCDYLGYSVHSIQAHVRIAHPAFAPTESGFICPACGDERSSVSAMVTHLEQCHAFEDFPNPAADQRLADGIRKHLDYTDKLAEFNRLYPEAS